MKAIYIFLIFLFCADLNAQIYLSTDFSGSFPPEGWTIDTSSVNWSIVNSNNAGSEIPEARFSYSPFFIGDSRLISPTIDLSGVTALKVKFNFMLDHYGGYYSVGVATRSGGSAWHVVWSVVNPTENIPATEEFVSINNSDLGAADFQICWYFSGNSLNIDYWYLDDIILFTSYDHDASVKSITTDKQYAPGATFSPEAIVKNFGIYSETFDATCKIKTGGSVVYQNNCSPATLNPDEETTVIFPEFTASSANDLYEITVTTNLSGDLNPGNDSKTKYFNTYTNQRNMVLMEYATDTWISYCVGAALGADDLITNGKSVAIIADHTSDSFSYAGSEARNNYYSVMVLPTAIFDGSERFAGGLDNLSLYSYYLPLYENRLTIKTAYLIDIYGDHSANDYTITVRVHKLAPVIPNNNCVLHVVLTESDIPYNWQTQDHLNFVSRVMCPDSNGSILDFSNGDIQDFNLSFALDPSWVSDNCELVAFIQNNDDQEVQQTVKLPLPDLIPLSTRERKISLQYSISQNFPNPFNPSTSITYSIPRQSNVTIKIYDVLGDEIQTLVNEPKSVGTYQVIWNATNLTSGVYFYQIRAGEYTAIKKMILLK